MAESLRAFGARGFGDRRVDRWFLRVILLIMGGAARKRRAKDLHQECLSRCSTHRFEEGTLVIIGIDPHKATHTAVAVDERELVLGKLEVRATGEQRDLSLRWAARFEERTWAV